jgi:type II secretory ATPase GspE/PulE/Tfp pilus assembly ATPase PilB-like protein
VKRSLLTANINGIVNQHLLSKLCPVCKTPHSPDPELLTEICKAAEEGGYHVPKSAEFYQSTGCDACQGKGFLRSRFFVHEYFTFTPALKAAFLRGVSQDEFTKLARESRQLSSFAAGIKKIVEEGSASLDEVMRKIPHWRT